jgi:LL-diaminopimelate aminotransferase
MAGWRVGFVVGNRQIIQSLRTLKTNLDYGIFAAIQKAAETALRLPDSYLEQVQERYRRRRDYLIGRLAELGWRIEPPRATMYLWIPTPALPTAPLRDRRSLPCGCWNLQAWS